MSPVHIPPRGILYGVFLSHFWWCLIQGRYSKVKWSYFDIRTAISLWFYHVFLCLFFWGRYRVIDKYFYFFLVGWLLYRYHVLRGPSDCCEPYKSTAWVDLIVVNLIFPQTNTRIATPTSCFFLRSRITGWCW